jgi:hypothetical protein
MLYRWKAEAARLRLPVEEPTEVLDLRYLAKCKLLSKQQRARQAAASVDQDIKARLSLKQLAQIYGVSPSLVSKCLKKKHTRTPTLASQLLKASAAERMAAAREVGVDEVWSTMIEPLV